MKILTQGGRLIAVQNRLNVIDPLQLMKGKTFLIEGILRSVGKGCRSSITTRGGATRPEGQAKFD